jgi:hypothetical protein
MQLGSTTSMYYEHVVSLVLTCIEHQVDNNKNNPIHSTIKSSKTLNFIVFKSIR